MCSSWKKLFPLLSLIAYRMDKNRAENILEIIRNGWLFKILALIKFGVESLAKCPSLIGELWCTVYVYFMTSPRSPIESLFGIRGVCVCVWYVNKISNSILCLTSILLNIFYGSRHIYYLEGFVFFL